MAKPVKYVDFGFASAREFWAEVVVPTCDRFKLEPTRANAIIASLHVWHLHEWIWHEQHPGVDTRGNSDYSDFKNALFRDCQELAWIRDVADAGKHRGLGRSVEVSEVVSKRRLIGSLNTAPLNTMPLNSAHAVTTPLLLMFENGNVCGFGDVLSRVVEYWRMKYFP